MELHSKIYADGMGPTYDYTPNGRLSRRTWARGATYAYDAQGRRVSKGVYSSTNSTFSTLHSTFVWDAWNIIRETPVTRHSSLVTSYVWGLDLDGTLQGAGGVGGLLAVVRSQPTTTNSSLVTRSSSLYLPTYDANGNITEYVSSHGAVVAHYEYSAFGEPTVSSGELASTFTHQFSTKPYCVTTGFNEYVYRMYAPNIGRWTSREPMGEKLSRNVYIFTNNRPTAAVDHLGLLVVYIGGAMEGSSGQLSGFQKAVGAAISFEWNQEAEAVDEIRKAIADNPCEPIVVIGHSWGGDTAMDVADDLKDDECLKCLYAVTLDPVSRFDPNTWFGGPYPGDHVTEWINIAQPAGFMDVVVDVPVVGWIVGGLWAAGSAIVGNNDGIATGGGQWNSESQATFDIPAVAPDGMVLDHHDVSGMTNLPLPGIDMTVKQYIDSLKRKDCCK